METREIKETLVDFLLGVGILALCVSSGLLIDAGLNTSAFNIQKLITLNMPAFITLIISSIIVAVCAFLQSHREFDSSPQKTGRVAAADDVSAEHAQGSSAGPNNSDTFSVETTEQHNSSSTEERQNKGPSKKVCLR